VAEELERFRFRISAWGYSPVSINIVTAAGFYIFVTALVCYLFRVNRTNILVDFAIASRRAWRSMSALFVGSAMVYLMVETRQIELLGEVLAKGGKLVYASLYPCVAFLGAIAFGQGLPGNYLFSRMQVAVAPVLDIPLAVLVGIVLVIAMGPPNALKPTQIAYSTSLADAKGHEAEIFRTCLPWQLFQLVVTALLSVIVVLAWT
jgi:L-lactate permease